MHRALCLTLVLATATCSKPSPAAPAPSAPANGAPVITSATVTPTMGIQDRTTFAFTASATDADSDALTYAWTIDGQPLTGATASRVFTTYGDKTATVTVTDGHGGTASSQQTFVVASLTGKWAGASPALGDYTVEFTQAPSGITGTFRAAWGTAPVTREGQQIPYITPTGEFLVEFFVPGITSFRFSGQMGVTGRLCEGFLSSNDFAGHNFTWGRVVP